jgi:hypothetical protein
MKNRLWFLNYNKQHCHASCDVTQENELLQWEKGGALALSRAFYQAHLASGTTQQGKEQ